MLVVAHEPLGFDGLLVQVEVDVRRGIPQMDLVGLAEASLREARERVRAAARNSGFVFPLDRILVNLAPATVPKEGPGYDLPIALAVLGAAGLLPDPALPVLAIGELGLDGSVRPVRGVLAAVASGLREGITDFIVPTGNLAEACSPGRGRIHGIAFLAEAVELLDRVRKGLSTPRPGPEGSDKVTEVAGPAEPAVMMPDFSEIKGLERGRRALEVAAAGGHNVLLFGPPGSGKTMLARRFPTILPELGEKEALDVTMIHSLAGILPEGSGILSRPPFRSPHHSSTREGLVGGGPSLRPGEASLAHRGVLFIDEAPEFHRDALQSLREPLEEGRVALARAGRRVRYPSELVLILAANPCPCGNLGREGKICVCPPQDILRYWRRMGAPLLDRIDIRVPLRPASARDLVGPMGESSAAIRERVAKAIAIQEGRYEVLGFSRNARLPPGLVERYCHLEPEAAEAFETAVAKLSLSSRACHAILKVSRTIADLSGRADIDADSLLEAVQHRRYGDGDFYWQDLR